jgi:hypothetical protein
METIDQYSFIGEHDHSELQRAHELVLYFKEHLFGTPESYTIQDLLFNRGATIDEDERPESYFGLVDAVWPRSQIKAGLAYTQRMIQISTEPGILIVNQPRIHTDGISGLILPAEIPDTTIITSTHGSDVDKIEYMQKEWMIRKGVSEKVRDLEKNLQSSFNEYNLKFMLYVLYDGSHQFIPSDWEEVSKMHEKIRPIEWRKILTPLDNAYYHCAKIFANRAGNIANELMKDEYGTLFVITPEDLQETMKNERSSMI